MAKKKSMLYPTLFMLVLSVVLTAALAALNAFTKPIVEFNSDIELKQKILYVFNIDTPSSDAEVIDKTFKDNVTEEEFNGKKVYVQNEEGNVKAYAVPFDGPGLWGGIEGYIGVTQDLSKVTGVDFTKQEETPGLGGRIEEAPYKEQFRDLDISKIENNSPIINRPANGGNVDAISGATQTSTFVMNMINEDLMEFIGSRKGAN